MTSATSYEYSVEICARQGTACRGVNYGVFDGNPSPQAYLLQTTISARVSDGTNRVTSLANAAVDSAIRLTGPGGQGREILQNGDFSSGSLTPWTQYSRLNKGSTYQLSDGKA